MKKAVIIGAGFSGLTPGMLLKQKGWDVTIIDKAGVTGGGVRTFFHGGHPFTYGPRHFLSPWDEAYEFLNKYVPLRHIKKINYTFIERDQQFYTYPTHEDDIAKMPDADKIRKELAERPEESTPRNFEELWTHRLGPTLYSKYIRDYNLKAWNLKSNTEADVGFEATVKLRPLEKGDRYEYRDWYNCYPIAHDGYNKYFDIAVEGCNLLLNTNIERVDVDNAAVYVKGEKIQGDILISTLSPDFLLNYQYGELKYVGREFFNIVLPTPQALPDDVYFCYYPNANEQQTRVVEYKKFTLHKSPFTLLGLEVPSMKNKLYPTMIREEVERAQKYLKALPKNVFSVGRMGHYKYIDIDDIIVDSIKMVKEL